MYLVSRVGTSHDERLRQLALVVDHHAFVFLAYL
jgi:hypothetical protein